MNGSFEITDDTLLLGNVEFYRTGSYQCNVDGAIDPVADGFDDLGSSSDRWDDIYATNGTIQTSDRRDKTNIRELDYGLQELMALKPVRFNWKEKSEQGDKLGLIAQDLQKVIAEVVKTHDYERQEDGSLKKVKNERLGVYYSDLIPVLIKSIQEQQQEIEELKAQNEELEQMKEELQSLKQQIKSLK
ncbi:MAG: tail fiber domain-containing protein [Owenweeksia sp.]|nr:tail fiber domain-containing protein [Owenweeksia sp.]